MHREKILKYKLCNSDGSQQKKVPDLSCEVQDLLLEVVDLKQEVPYLSSGWIPRQFNPRVLVIVNYAYAYLSTSIMGKSRVRDKDHRALFLEISISL